MEKLVKIKGVRVVISLLNPDLPFEKSLLEKEKKVISRFGVSFYNVPLPFINLDSPSNYKTVAKIREILRKHPGEKVYIHCYLGRHRVGFVAKLLLGVVR